MTDDDIAILKDVAIAARQLRQMSSQSSLIVLGFRLSATIAMMACSTINRVEALVLVDPIPSGHLFRNDPGVDPGVDATASEFVEIHGDLYSSKLVEELRGLNLSSPSLDR